MAQFVVLEDFVSGRIKLSAGSLIDDTQLDVPALVDSGIAIAPLAGDMADAITAYLKQRNNSKRSVVPLGLMLANALRSTGGASLIGTLTGQSVETRIAGAVAGEFVAVSGTDTNADFLDPKLDPGAGLTRTIVNPGANEQVRLDVGANADGSITVNADDVQVGVLATDGQHGARGGGTQHAVAIASGAAGFLSGSDKNKLDGVATGAAALTASAPANVTKAAADVGVGTTAARADHKHDVTTATPSVGVGLGNAEGSATSLARSDHGHALREAGGPTDLTLGTVQDSHVLTRVGTSIVGLNVIATWTGTRYFAVDYDAGSDSNAGFSDVSLAAAGAVAKKTVEGIKAVFPVMGQGQKAVIAIRRRAAGAVYRNAADTADADMDIAAGLFGYQHIVMRGTGDLATAGAVAFANDAADKIACGAQTVPGTNGPGYEPTGVPTTSVFTCQLTGGGAPGLAAEPSLIGKRIRFDSATTTVALRNECRMIHANTTDTITVDQNLSATPVLTDVFYIEEPGVAFDRIIMSSSDVARTALPPSFSNNGVSVAGFRLPNTGGAHLAISCRGVSGTLLFSFLDIASPAFGAGSFVGPGVMAVDASYIDANDVFFRPGVGIRTVGWCTASVWSSLVLNCTVAAAGRWQVLNIGPSAFSVGQGSYFGVGLLFQNCRASGGTQNTVGGNRVGNNASSSIRRCRITGGFSDACLSMTNSDVFVRGVDIQGVGGTSLMSLRGIGMNLVINDVVGSTGNTGIGLDLTLTRDSNVLLGQLNANTFTAGAGRDIEMSGPVRHVHADYALTDLRDNFGNHAQGNGNSLIGSVIRSTNDAFADVGKYKIVRAVGSGTSRAAQADTAANSAGVVGVSQSPATAAGTQEAMLVNAGGTWVQFDAGPTAGAIAYLSTATAGNAQVAIPAVAGTNQKLRLGRVLRVSGTLGLIAWRPDTIPVLADGLA